MSNLTIKGLFKNFIYSFLAFIIFVEFFFQIVFFTDLKFLKKPILFFNPYCDQLYWDHVKETSINEELYRYHPTLTIIKNQNSKTFDSANKKLLSKDNNDIVFYGSSFIDHKYFLPNFKNNSNYAVKSYGLDQVFLSYELTKEYHKNNTIVIGFLMEDLDRVLFQKRNLPKIKYTKSNNGYALINKPVTLEKKKQREYVFYTYNLFKNLFFLFFNDFDHKKSECEIEFKKNLFKFFIDQIVQSSSQLNQKVIFITFNSQDSILKNNWRYPFITRYLSQKGVIHLDSKETIIDYIENNNLEPSDLYSLEDYHLNKIGNDLIIKELNGLIGQHK